ncbi:early nodulin-like protein 7 [Euphorbia lathyris]|uniref:early nodulin-like protein 7 n=1 Tax=Euphorbia lathyris TaxID=212925 RepID=UPI0033143FEB
MHFYKVVVSSYEFQVGGHKGWTKPPPNDAQIYNHWATQNRFHVGDSLHFKYENDSVLIVNATAYEKCDVSNPIDTFDDGDTVFKIDRDGLFYFISGHIEHCMAGQKMVLRVMVQPRLQDNGSDDWDAFNWGPPLNSTLTNSSIASYFLTAFGGVFALLYLLM